MHACVCAIEKKEAEICQLWVSIHRILNVWYVVYSIYVIHLTRSILFLIFVSWGKPNFHFRTKTSSRWFIFDVDSSPKLKIYFKPIYKHCVRAERRWAICLNKQMHETHRHIQRERQSVRCRASKRATERKRMMKTRMLLTLQTKHMQLIYRLFVAERTIWFGMACVYLSHSVFHWCSFYKNRHLCEFCCLISLCEEAVLRTRRTFQYPLFLEIPFTLHSFRRIRNNHSKIHFVICKRANCYRLSTSSSPSPSIHSIFFI